MNEIKFDNKPGWNEYLPGMASESPSRIDHPAMFDAKLLFVLLDFSVHDASVQVFRDAFQLHAQTALEGAEGGGASLQFIRDGHVGGPNVSSGPAQQRQDRDKDQRQCLDDVELHGGGG
jgi:hypothetical protein